MKYLITFILTISVILTNCSAPKNTRETSKDNQQLGMQLWLNECQRCHNIPDPTDFNDAQWDVIGAHMRTRANITGKEMELIVGFIKSANNK